MKALCWFGKGDVRYESVPDPEIVNPHDALVRVTRTAICGSDLHFYDGFMPLMRKGDVLGHEFMGEVVAVGPAVEKLKVGAKVVVAFAIACGRCWFCREQLFALCDDTNPNAWISEQLYGQPVAGTFGYTHLTGGYAGGQAELVRVPFADVGCIDVGNADEEKALFLSDILPTAYQAAENCVIRPGDVVAVWGLGPVGQLSVACAYLLGAERVIGIDDVPERLELARDAGRAEIIDFGQTDALEALRALTGGRGADACIDAVGMEAHGTGVLAAYDRVKTAVRLETDRPTALRSAILGCRKAGVVSAPGVYGGLVDKVPFGAAFNKGLTLAMGQTHVQRYMRPLFDRILAGDIDPSFVISHRLALADGPEAYRMFRDKRDRCIKVVMRP